MAAALQAAAAILTGNNVSIMVQRCRQWFLMPTVYVNRVFRIVNYFNRVCH
jgi:hypothetical protein